MALAINAMGYQAVSLNGQQAGIYTEDLPNRARILEIKTDTIEKHLNDGYIVLITGFQGVNSKGEFTTLGRGGSDRGLRYLGRGTDRRAERRALRHLHGRARRVFHRSAHCAGSHQD
jgi:aspartokinase